MADKLEEARALLEQHGWKVERPPFDDPYEVMYRRMLREGAGEGHLHPEDDPTSTEYVWNEWEARCLRFLKEHFTLKTEGGD